MNAKVTPRRDDHAILYTRVSTNEQVDTGTSLATQLAETLNMSSEIGARVVKHCEDAGVSGALYKTRLGLQEALALIEAGEANILIVSTLSRLSRDDGHQSSILKRLRRANARLVCCDATFDDTASGAMLLGIHGAINNGYRLELREKSIKGKLRRVQEGKMPARTWPPYGYKIITKLDVLKETYEQGPEGTYEIVEEQARWAREIFERYAAGATLRGLARFLFEQGVPTSKGRAEWDHTTLSNMLRNPIYKGQAAYGRTQQVTDKNERSFRRDTNASTWLYVSAPRLVSDEVWDACQKALNENQSRSSGNGERRQMLTGLVRCPGCNGKMTTHATCEKRRWKSGDGYKQGMRQRFVYYCPQRPKMITDCPLHRKQNEGAPLDAKVIAKVRDIARHPQLLQEAYEYHRAALRQSFSEQEFNRLCRDLQQLSQREETLVESQMRGIMAGADTTIYETKLRELCERRSVLQERLAGIESTREASLRTVPAEKAAVMQSLLTAVDTALLAPEITVAEKHALLAKVIEAIYPDDGDVRIQFKDVPQTV